MGGTFVAEEWPEQRRRMGAGLMHTGYYVGIFLAALANYGIGSHYGWRAMFIVGGVPALLLGVGFGTGGLRSPWRGKRRKAWSDPGRSGVPSPRCFSAAWAPPYHPEPLIDAGFHHADCGPGLSMCLRRLPRSPKRVAVSVQQPAQLASWGIMLVSFATNSRLPGDALAGGAVGASRGASGFLYSHDGFSLRSPSGKVFYLGATALPWVFRVLFFSGAGAGANFAVYTLWLPEQYPTECRASAFAFFPPRSPGLAGRAITFWLEPEVRHYGSLETPAGSRLRLPLQLGCF